MSLKEITTLTALAVAAALGFSGSANASYTYSTTFTIGYPGGGGFATSLSDSVTAMPAVITYTGTPATQLTPAAMLPVGSVQVTNSGSSIDFTAFYTIQVSITNNSSTASFYIFGALIGTNVQGTSGTVGNQYIGVSTTNTSSSAGSASQLIGGLNFTVSEPIGTPTDQNFVQPSVGVSPGSFGALISTVPEPASAVMVGLGLGGVGLVCLRNRQRRARV